MSSLAVLLTDAQCASPASGCKAELAVAIRVLLWLMAGLVTVLAALKLMAPLLSGQDSPELDLAERRGLFVGIVRRMIPLLMLVLLEGLILGLAQSWIASW